MSSECQTLQFDLSIAEKSEEIKSYGITCIEYDPSLPHRFTLGTEQGVILSCNRKFKEVKDMVTSCYCTHSVPIINITRNAFFPKLFASCCAWDIKIWSDDLTVSPILTLRSQNGYCTDATWTPAHASYLFVTKTTGHLELWDILIKNHEPIVSFKLESDGLSRVLTKQQGEQLVCGTSSGCIHLLHVPEYYASTKQEKNLVAAMIDREGKREKFLEGKNRERKVREKICAKKIEMGHTPSEIANEKQFATFDDKLDVVDSGSQEFQSVFDPDMKGDDEEIGETAPEKAIFDMQFCDVLKVILEEVKQS